MGSKYQKSVRGPLTLWAFMLEVTLILIFFFFTSYETSVKEQKKLMRTYRGECPEGRWSQRQIEGAGEEEVCGPPRA